MSLPVVDRVEARTVRFQQAIRAGRVRHGVALLAVVNVTPDSFSDGGLYLEARKAVEHAHALVAAGATMLDVGAESTRPGSPPVPDDEQIRRALPVVEAMASVVPVTIDTTHPAVARACLEAGALAINDVACARDSDLARVAAHYEAAYIVSHARRGQGSMATFGAWPEDGYTEVVQEVCEELCEARERLCKAGVDRAGIVLDPGLGFTKSALQSAALLRDLRMLAEKGPVLVGASRKSFLTLAIGSVPPTARLGASVAAALWAARHGASLVRVHDVDATAQALAVERFLERLGRGTDA